MHAIRKIKFAGRKDEIRAELLRLAMEGRTTTFSELGKKLGIPTQGPWKPILDEIRREEIGQGLPDLTLLVIAKQYGVPGQIAFQLSRFPEKEQREAAREMIEKVLSYYRQLR
jgi:hypothetical protein